MARTLSHKSRFLVAALVGCAMTASPALAADLNGVWRTPNGVMVAIENCGNAYCGFADAGGAQPALMLEHGAEPRVWQAVMHDPGSGTMRRGIAQLVSDGTLRLRGCAPIDQDCVIEDWQKVD